MSEELKKEFQYIFDILDLRKYLQSLNDDKCKIEYLEQLGKELKHFEEHYTDDNIEEVLRENGWNKKIHRNQIHSDQPLNHSDYELLKKIISKNLRPFIKSEIFDLKEKQFNNAKNNPKLKTVNLNVSTINQKPTFRKIKWNSLDTDLYYFLKVLKPEKGDVVYINFMKNNFIGQKGKLMSTKNLKALANNLIRKSRNGDTFEDIIDKSKDKQLIDLVMLANNLIKMQIINRKDKEKFRKGIEEFMK